MELHYSTARVISQCLNSYEHRCCHSLAHDMNYHKLNSCLKWKLQWFSPAAVVIEIKHIITYDIHYMVYMYVLHMSYVYY